MVSHTVKASARSHWCCPWPPACSSVFICNGVLREQERLPENCLQSATSAAAVALGLDFAVAVVDCSGIPALDASLKLGPASTENVVVMKVAEQTPITALMWPT